MILASCREGVKRPGLTALFSLSKNHKMEFKIAQAALEQW